MTEEAVDIREETAMRVLLVDMSPITRKLIGRLLIKQGYDFAEASNGSQALQMLQESYFDVVMTGLVLEDMSGVEFCAAVRKADLPRYIYIIALSGKSTVKDISNALNAGADEFMSKPVVKPILYARLNVASRIIDLETKLRLVKMQSQDLLMKDPLTEVYNRRRIQKDLPAEIKRASRYQNSLSIVICDLDHFKSVNDTYGHLAGDKVLKEVAQRLRSCCRSDIDWVARYGGEEFVIVLPETSVEGATIFAENLRQTIECAPFQVSNGTELQITMSFGAAGFSTTPGATVSPDEMLGQADLCLYKAKAEGRNRVCYTSCLSNLSGGVN